MLSIISMLSVESIFYTPRDKKEQAAKAKKKYASIDGDHITLLEVYNEYIKAKNKKGKKLKYILNN